MSIRLRSTGKPCLRSPRGALLAVAGVVALTTAPATAAYADHVKPLGWYAEEAAVPATVQFQDVASDGATVLAAGQDGDALTGTAAIYRRVGDAWQAETLPATLASPSVITDVAVSGSEEWAVGEQNGAPVVLQNVNGTWLTPQGTGAITTTPKSVAVRGSTALIGDEAGNVHFFTGQGHSNQEAFAAGAINGVAVTGDAAGIAVAGYEAFPVLQPTSVRIYSVAEGSQPMLDDQATGASTTEVDMTGVAAASNGAAVALDETAATWHRTDAGDWVRDATLTGATPADVSSLAVSSTNVREALAGSVGSEGTIWQRERYKGHDYPWQRQTLAAGTKPLAGVALTGPESGFAVGADGTVLRLWRPADPEAHAAWEQAEADRIAAEEAAAQQAEADRLAAEQAEADRLAAEQAAADQAAAEQAAADQAAAEQAAAEQQQQQPTAETSSPPPPPPVEQDDIRMNGVVIDDAEPRETRTGQRLLKNVRAVRRGQKLIVSFRLTAKARVALTAKRGRRVIAKTRMRTLRRGRRTLVLRFSGRPPSSLKVVVRRVSGARDNR